MSSTYIPQPPTTGKVILITSHGQLDIELWSRQSPLACKNFIQLCLQGYYDKTIFHRLIPGFMVQGGDPTGTGRGGESIYGAPFKDQFHQRLKFTHRGLVAMANEGRNSNNSQFFITFGEALHLNKKHTIFGKVVGNTMFNLMSMQAEETDESDRPNIPPRVLRTKVIINPFDDIKPRELGGGKEQGVSKEEMEAKNQKTKEESKGEIKKLKKKNLLSFEDEEGNEVQQSKILSSHDALDDKKLSKQVIITQQELGWKRKMRELEEQKVQNLKKLALQQPSDHIAKDIAENLKDKLKKRHQQSQNTSNMIEDDITKFETRINLQNGKRQIYWKSDTVEPDDNDESQSQQIDNDQLRELRQLQKKEFDAIKINELRFKEVQEGSLNPAERLQRMQEKSLLSNVERRRIEFIQKRDMELKQGGSLVKLQDFRKRIKSKSHTQVPSWLSHRLKFHIDSENAFRHIKEDQDDGGLMVIDTGATIGDQYKLQKKGIDTDELMRLTKEHEDD